MPQQSESVSDCILRWLTKLSKHFNQELGEDQMEIFIHALRDCTTYQLNKAFDRCLNELEFVPKLAQVHERIPENKWPENYTGFIQQRPILEVVREVARELYPNYDQLEGQELLDAVIAANRERYRRMGIDPDNFAGRMNSSPAKRA